MKRITLPDFLTSSSSFLIRSSNSPRYLVPATMPERSRDRRPLVQHLVGHIAHDDLPGQALGDGGLAHAGLTDQAGVVLGAAGENLDHPLDLPVPADDRVQLAGPGVGGQVPGELLQGLVLAVILLGGAGAGAARDRRPGSGASH